jgi:PAS domain S-box-containing protein
MLTELFALGGLAVVVAKWLADSDWAVPILMRIGGKIRKLSPGYKNSVALQNIISELRPNGGASLKDAVTRLERGVEDNTRLLMIVRHKQKWFAETLGVAMFETDELGRCTFANEAYLELTGLSLEEVKSEGWRNVIEKGEMEEVFRDWDMCVLQGRDFHRSTIYYNRKENTRRLVNIDAYVIHDYHEAGVIGWIGYVHPVQADDPAAAVLPRLQT